MRLKIREELLHYIWRMQAYDKHLMRTDVGDSLEILNPGIHNHNAGPDFLNGKVRIDNTIWVGHIELHLRSSDWNRHAHGGDMQYQNVVLHVVYHHDEDIKMLDGTIIPCLSLESRIHPSLLERYQLLMNSTLWIPCQAHISQVEEVKKYTSIQRNLADRLEEKTAGLLDELMATGGDLSRIVYQQLAWAMGLSVNSEAMKTLMISIPYHIFQKHRDNLFQIEALLFGQSGMLEPATLSDEYPDALHREYQVLRAKYGLVPMSPTHWKYMRLRPAAFPTIRIAQLAKLIHTNDRLDQLVLDGKLASIHRALEVKAEGYWKYHYNWNTPSKPISKALGKSKREVILINAVAPLLWMYGRYRDSQKYRDQAILLLESIPAEKNSIIDRWSSLNLKARNAAETQGLIQLKKTKCNQQACLSCAIGHAILSEK